MKKLMVASVLVMGSVSAFAGQNQSCLKQAEKVALSLYVLENSISEFKQLTDLSSKENSKGKFSVNFIDNSGDTEESAVMYQVEMEGSAPNCTLKSVKVDFAG